MVSLYHRIKWQVNGKNYCLKHIRKLAAKGANSACVEEKVVYGWAVHYFEEESIEGTLYNEDGTEYKPAPKPTPAKVKTVEPKKPEQRQPTLFDFMEPETPEPEVKDENNDDEDEQPYGIVKQSREEISSRLFSWQNFLRKAFFGSVLPKRQGAVRFGRLPFLCLHIPVNLL